MSNTVKTWASILKILKIRLMVLLCFIPSSPQRLSHRKAGEKHLKRKKWILCNKTCGSWHETRGFFYLLTNWLAYLYGRIQSPRLEVMPDRRKGITRATDFGFACIRDAEGRGEQRALKSSFDANLTSTPRFCRHPFTSVGE